MEWVWELKYKLTAARLKLLS